MRTGKNKRPGVNRLTLRIYLAEALKTPWRFGMAFVASGLYVLANDILTPYLIGLLIDSLTQAHRDVGHINNLVWWMIIVFSAGTFIFARLTFFFRNRLITSVERSLNMVVFDAYERQEYNFFTNNFVGSLVARSQRFVGTFKDLFDITVFSLLTLLIQLIGAISILAFKAPILSAIFIIVTTAMLVIVLITNRYKMPVLKRSAKAGSDVTAGLADVLTNSLAVKVFAASSSERKRFLGLAEHRRQVVFGQTRVTERIRILRSIVGVLFQIISVVVLVRLALADKISIGTILIAQLYLMRLEGSLWEVSRVSERIEETLADAAEMTEVILREPELQDIADPQPLEVTRGELAFDGVRYHYSDNSAENELFQNLNLVMKPGQKVGLVGPSGGGKTTFTKLLLRFMDIQDGTISIDGQDIAKVRQEDLRRSIAYVPQEPLLFHRSIKENIAYGDPNASEEAVIRAAQLAHADEFITRLPNGYDTLVGERGVKLSGGEKQRVAIARAMLKQSPIVILDEATSALDSKSEKAIVSALDNLMKGRTTIVIAHRLSTIRKLDRIVVLKDGQIVEDGTHDALLQLDGLYADLWRHQSGEFLPED